MPELEKENLELTSQQKVGLGILAFLGIFALVFGLLQFFYNVKAPFAGRGTGAKTFKTTEEQELENLLALQSKDTDNDGITDFDELYTYKTSPYLEDSDSDGFPDKQEIDSGNDPNCPVGKECILTEEQPKESEGSSSLSLPSGLSNFNLGILQGQATPDEIREMLRQQGVSDEALSKVDDKTLMEVYQEVLKETPLPSELNINTNAGANSGSIDFSKLSAEEIRELLRQAGVEEELLKSLDDETLRKIFEESIK